MTKILRYCFCILAVLCAAAIIPVGALVGWIYALLCAGGMTVFAALLLLVNDGNPFRRKPRHTDFMNSEQENAEILARRSAEERSDAGSQTTSAEDGFPPERD